MGVIDSGLVVVVTILVFLITVMMVTLLYVKYEWCHVLFRNNTVSQPDHSRNILQKASISSLLKLELPCGVLLALTVSAWQRYKDSEERP